MAYEIDRNCYIKATPAGAYYCMNSVKDELARAMLKVLLSAPSTPYLTNNTVESLFSVESSIGLRVLHHLQKLNWVEFLQAEQAVESGKIETLFTQLLSALSLEGKVLLASSAGVGISSVGFSNETAKELAYLSTDILALQKRHKWLLNDSLKYPSSNWGTIDAAGHSQIGFWPLHVGSEVYSLVISGVPRLTDQAFMQLAWLLHTRYSSNAESLVVA